MIQGRVVVVVVAMQVLVILFAQSRTKRHFCLVFPVVFQVVSEIKITILVLGVLIKMSQEGFMDKSTRTVIRIGSQTFSSKNQVCVTFLVTSFFPNYYSLFSIL